MSGSALLAVADALLAVAFRSAVVEAAAEAAAAARVVGPDLAGARSVRSVRSIADSRSALEMRIMRSSTSRCSAGAEEEEVEDDEADAGVRAEALRVGCLAETATVFAAIPFEVARCRDAAIAADAAAAVAAEEVVVALSGAVTSRGESAVESGRMLCRSDIPMASCCSWSSTGMSASSSSVPAAGGLGAPFGRCANSEDRKERCALRSMTFAGKVGGFHILAHT